MNTYRKEKKMSDQWQEDFDAIRELADFTLVTGCARELPDVEREAARAAGFSGPYAARFAGWPADRCAQILAEWHDR